MFVFAWSGSTYFLPPSTKWPCPATLDAAVFLPIPPPPHVRTCGLLAYSGRGQTFAQWMIEYPTIVRPAPSLLCEVFPSPPFPGYIFHFSTMSAFFLSYSLFSTFPEKVGVGKKKNDGPNFHRRQIETFFLLPFSPRAMVEAPFSMGKYVGTCAHASYSQNDQFSRELEGFTTLIFKPRLSPFLNIRL